MSARVKSWFNHPPLGLPLWFYALLLIAIHSYFMFTDQIYNEASGVAIDNQDNVYVFQTRQGQIQKYNSNGNLLLSWGRIGSGPGEFDKFDGFHSSLAVDTQDNVYVVDSQNLRIEKFDANGKFLLAFSTKDAANRSKQPNHVAVDKQGNIYVSDGGLRKFDARGNFLQQFDIKDNNNQNEGASGIAIDQQGNVLVVCAYNVLKFTPDGKFLTKWPHQGFTNNIAIDAQGYIYTDDMSELIRKFDVTGKLLETWRTSDNFGVIVQGLAVDSHNVIYEATTASTDAGIVKYNSSGDYLGVLVIGFLNGFLFADSFVPAIYVTFSSISNIRRKRGKKPIFILSWANTKLGRTTQIVAANVCFFGGVASLVIFLKMLIAPFVFSRLSQLFLVGVNTGLINILTSGLVLISFVVGFLLSIQIPKKPLWAGFGLLVVSVIALLTWIPLLMFFALMLIFAGVLSLVVWNKTKPSFN